MPQVFSVGWLYLVIIVMIISIVRIWYKVRAIQKEAPMDRPVIKVASIPKTEPETETPGHNPVLAAPDTLIRQGAYKDALSSLASILEDLSPTEDRELRGMVLFRIGACYSRLATGGDRFQYLLRAGEALREAVRMFSPPRYRTYYLQALGELAGLYEDLARGKNPVGNLNQAARTSETGAASARESGLAADEAVFLVRAGNAHRQLAIHSEPQVNLRKAVDHYERAAVILNGADSKKASSGQMKILKILGDTYTSLADYYQRKESLNRAMDAYEGVLKAMGETKQPEERTAVLTDMCSVILALYDAEKSPAHIRQALRCGRDALDASRDVDTQVLKGLAMAAMGDALTRYADVKDRKENLERAARLYETALGLIREGEEPGQREMIRESLAETVEKITGVGKGVNGGEGEKT